MRILFIILTLINALSLEAQVNSSLTSMTYTPWPATHGYPSFNDSNYLNHQKWHFSKYAGICAGFGLFNGVNAAAFSTTVGLGLNLPLNNNLMAFAAVSAGPTFFNFTQSLTNPMINNSYPGGNPINTYGYGINSRIEMGLMYMNDAKTFSVSGSIGVENSSYPVYPSSRPNIKKQ